MDELLTKYWPQFVMLAAFIATWVRHESRTTYIEKRMAIQEAKLESLSPELLERVHEMEKTLARIDERVALFTKNKPPQ